MYYKIEMRTIEDYRTYIDMENIQVTVFIVTYNRCKSLKKAIDSVIKQTYNAIAIVILDNASTDATYNLVVEYENENIFYFCQKSNVGGICNINTAFDLAQTPYYMVFHDDDVMTEQLVEKELKEITDNGYACVGSHAILKGDLENKVKQTLKNAHINIFSKDEYFKYVIQGGEAVIFPTVIYRKSFIKKFHIRLDINAGPCCDYYLLSEICMRGGSLCVMPDELLIRNIHAEMDSIQSAFWMNIQVLNYFCHDRRYIWAVKCVEREVLNGYIKNGLHLIANSYENQVAKEKVQILLNNIPINIFENSIRTKILKNVIKNTNKRLESFSNLLYKIRKCLRRIKYREFINS